MQLVSKQYFGFPGQSSFHQLLHNHPHLSSGACTIGQKWPQYLVDLVPPHKKEDGKHAYNNRVLLETVFYIQSVQSGYKEELIIGSRVPEFQVESWALQGRLRRWRYEIRCGVLTSGQRRDHRSWRISIVKTSENTAEKYPLLRAVTKQRLMKEDREDLA
jgi:hypothetical protein